MVTKSLASMSRLPENHPEFGDILDHRALTARCREADGIIHLAAVARVKHAEADPDRCWAVNVIGTENVIAAALAAPYRPWVLTTSSREVYGEPARTPVVEGDPVAPINVYGRSKAACEEVTLGGRNKGAGAGHPAARQRVRQRSRSSRPGHAGVLSRCGFGSANAG
jgi:nucleoside-diphosphate-sugar epimerase